MNREIRNYKLKMYCICPCVVESNQPRIKNVDVASRGQCLHPVGLLYYLNK